MSDAPKINRRRWTGRAVDAVMGYWLGGVGNGDAEAADALMEWWTDGDGAADAALVLVHIVAQAIEDAGFEIVERGEGT